MKTLDFCSADLIRYPVRSGRVSILPVGGVLAGVIILLLAFWLYGFPQRQARALIENRSHAIIELAAAAAAKPAMNVRSSLSLLARLPILRNLKAGGLLMPAFKARQEEFQLLVQSFEFPLASFWQRFFEVENGFAWWCELPDALIRRFFMVVTFNVNVSEEESDDSMFDFKAVSIEDQGRIVDLARLVPASIELLSDIGESFLSPLVQMAGFVDALPGFRDATRSSAVPIENLLALMLDDGQLRALALKTLNGSVVAAAGDAELITSDPDNRDCRVISTGVPFFSGPVLFNQQYRRAVWWVAVPVRDGQRQPVACLSAMVDISFLSEMAARMETGPDSLIFTERSGVAIGHHDSQLVSQQVNLSASLLPIAMVGDKPLSSVLRRSDRLILQTATALKNTGHRYLPDWYVFVLTDLSAAAGYSDFIIYACVILLAATGMYVLSCCVVRITNSLHEEI